MLECPLYTDERALMWTRIKGFRRTTDLQALLGEKKAAVAIAQFIHDTGILAQFVGADPQAMGTSEQAPVDNTESNDQGTDLVTRIATLPGDVSARSAHPPVMTNIEADTSLGSIQVVPVDRGESEDERGDGNVQIGARVRAIDLWD